MAEVAQVAIDEDDLSELELDDEFDWMDESDVDEGDDVDQIYEVAVARGLGVSEDVEEDEDGDEILLTEDDAMEDEESGWLPDPDVEGHERFWDGTEWIDQVRPVEEEGDFRGRLHLPYHVPELQRALAAATADIDDVEARLSTLFDRGQGKRGARADAGADAGAGAGAAAGDAAGGGTPIHDEFGGASGAGADASSHDGVDPILTGGEGAGAVSVGDDEETFAELDAALAAEAPEKSERRFFKRRS
jgi:hypothetical protein